MNKKILAALISTYIVIGGQNLARADETIVVSTEEKEKTDDQAEVIDDESIEDVSEDIKFLEEDGNNPYEINKLAIDIDYRGLDDKDFDETAIPENTKISTDNTLGNIILTPVAGGTYKTSEKVTFYADEDLSAWADIDLYNKDPKLIAEIYKRLYISSGPVTVNENGNINIPLVINQLYNPDFKATDRLGNALDAEVLDELSKNLKVKWGKGTFDINPIEGSSFEYKEESQEIEKTGLGLGYDHDYSRRVTPTITYEDKEISPDTTYNDLPEMTVAGKNYKIVSIDKNPIEGTSLLIQDKEKIVKVKIDLEKIGINEDFKNSTSSDFDDRAIPSGTKIIVADMEDDEINEFEIENTNQYLHRPIDIDNIYLDFDNEEVESYEEIFRNFTYEESSNIGTLAGDYETTFKLIQLYNPKLEVTWLDEDGNVMDNPTADLPRGTVNWGYDSNNEEVIKDIDFKSADGYDSETGMPKGEGLVYEEAFDLYTGRPIRNNKPIIRLDGSDIVANDEDLLKLVSSDIGIVLTHDDASFVKVGDYWYKVSNFESDPINGVKISFKKVITKGYDIVNSLYPDIPIDLKSCDIFAENDWQGEGNHEDDLKYINLKNLSPDDIWSKEWEENHSDDDCYINNDELNPSDIWSREGWEGVENHEDDNVYIELTDLTADSIWSREGQVGEDNHTLDDNYINNDELNPSDIWSKEAWEGQGNHGENNAYTNLPILTHKDIWSSGGIEIEENHPDDESYINLAELNPSDIWANKNWEGVGFYDGDNDYIDLTIITPDDIWSREGKEIVGNHSEDDEYTMLRDLTAKDLFSQGEEVGTAYHKEDDEYINLSSLSAEDIWARGGIEAEGNHSDDTEYTKLKDLEPSDIWSKEGIEGESNHQDDNAYTDLASLESTDIWSREGIVGETYYNKEYTNLATLRPEDIWSNMHIEGVGYHEENITYTDKLELIADKVWSREGFEGGSNHEDDDNYIHLTELNPADIWSRNGIEGAGTHKENNKYLYLTELKPSDIWASIEIEGVGNHNEDDNYINLTELNPNLILDDFRGIDFPDNPIYNPNQTELISEDIFITEIPSLNENINNDRPAIAYNNLPRPIESINEDYITSIPILKKEDLIGIREVKRKPVEAHVLGPEADISNLNNNETDPEHNDKNPVETIATNREKSSINRENNGEKLVASKKSTTDNFNNNPKTGVSSILGTLNLLLASISLGSFIKKKDL